MSSTRRFPLAERTAVVGQSGRRIKENHGRTLTHPTARATGFIVNATVVMKEKQ